MTTESINEAEAAHPAPLGWLAQRLSPSARRFACALSWNIAGHALARVTVLLAGLGITRSLGVDAFADFTFYLFSINLLAALSDMGVSFAMMKYGVVARLEGGGSESIDHLAAALQLGLGGFVLSFAAMILFTRVETWPSWQIAALGLAGIAVVWQVTFAAVLISMRRLRETFIGNAIFAMLLLVGVAAGAWSVSPMPAMLAYPAAAFAQCLYQARLVNREFRLHWTAWLRPRLREMPGIFGLIGYMAPTSLIASALPWAVANIQLAQGTGKTALAVYGAATMLFGLTMTVPGRIAQLFFIDQVEQTFADQSVRRFVWTDLKAVGISMSAALAMSAALFIAGDLLLDRYGAAISRHSPAIYALAAVAVIVCPYQIIGSRIVSVGWQQLWLAISIVQAVVLLAVVWDLPVSAEWTPSLAYWVSYAIALAFAMPLYVYSTRRARA